MAFPKYNYFHGTREKTDASDDATEFELEWGELDLG